MKPMHQVFTPSTRELTQEAEASLRPPHLLLAEDDYELRRLLSEVLESQGYEVTQVEDGYQLLDELAGELLGDDPRGYDLVISDIRMPGCTGLEVLDGLRACNWRIRFLFITAFGDNDAHAEAYRLGGTILDKPFRIGEFCDAVRALASGRSYRAHRTTPAA